MAKKADATYNLSPSNELNLIVTKEGGCYGLRVQHKNLGKDIEARIKFPETKGRLINAMRQAVKDWEGKK